MNRDQTITSPTDKFRRQELKACTVGITLLVILYVATTLVMHAILDLGWHA